MRTLSLFSGCLGLDLGLEQIGADPVAYVENNEACQRVIYARRPGVPILADVHDVDDTVGDIDLVAGGFPCQDLSYAGKGAGLDGDRSGLWHEMARAVRVVRPRLVLVENVPGLATRGLGRVLYDLAEAGYVGSWVRLRAADIGAPHGRERLFILACAADAAGTRDGALPGGAPRDEGGHAWGPADGDHVARGAGAGGVRAADGAAAPDAEREPVRAGERAAPRAAGAGAGEGSQRERLWADDRERGAAAADADGRRREQRDARLGRVPVAGAGGAPAAADAGHPRREGGGGAERARGREGVVGWYVGPPRSRPAFAYPACRDEPRVGDEEGLAGGSDGRAAADPDAVRRGRREDDEGVAAAGRDGAAADRSDGVEWGVYERAIRRWEHIFGRPAPRPTDARGRLNPRFVEWMLGFPDGWTDVTGVARTAQLKMLGNAVQVQVGAVAGALLAGGAA